jgi:hypothetical protein
MIDYDEVHVTFRCDQRLRDMFKAKVYSRGKNITEVFTDFMQLYVDNVIFSDVDDEEARSS